MLASDFTWSDYVKYVISKVNQRLGLLRSIKHLLPLNTPKLDHSMELTVNRNIPNYNTKNRDMLRLPLATKDWGKQRVCCHSLKDWNNLNKATRNAPDIVNFKRSIFSSFYIQFFVFQLQLFINSLYSFCTYFYF